MGMWHTAALKRDGSLWTWGRNSWGQLGVEGKDTREPQKVMDGVIAIEASYGNTFAIDGAHTLWGCGVNHDEGIDDSGIQKIKQPVKMAAGVGWVCHQSGTTCVIKEDGRLLTRGAFAKRFALPLDGDGYALLADGVVSACGCGSALFYVTSDGVLYALGENIYGFLGCGERAFTSVEPVKVLDEVKLVACEALGTAFAIRTDGSLWGWGQDNCMCREENGEVRPISDRFTYAPIRLFDHVADMVASDGTMMFLKENGEAWGMGYSFDVKRAGFCRVVETDVAALIKGPEHYGVIKNSGDILIWELTGKEYGATHPKQKPVLLSL